MSIQQLPGILGMTLAEGQIYQGFFGFNLLKIFFRLLRIILSEVNQAKIE